MTHDDETPIYDALTGAGDRVEQPPQLAPAALAGLDEHEPDPPEFDRSLVPDGPARDYFFSGRSGRGLTNAEWDEQVARAALDPQLLAILRPGA